MRQWMLGLLFLGGLAILTYFTVFLSSFGLGDGVTLSVVLSDGIGLQPGDKVLASGTRIGRVREVEYRDDAPLDSRVLVLLQLDRKISIYANYVARVEASTLLGGRVVNIHPGGPAGHPVADLSKPLRGSVQVDVLDAVGAVFTDNRATIAASLRSLNEALDAARDILVESRREQFPEQLSGVLEELTAVLSSFRDERSTMGKLLTSDALHAEFLGLTRDVREILRGIARGEGSLGMLLTDSRLFEDLLAAASDIREFAKDLQSGTGIAGALAGDEHLRQSLESLVANLDRIVEAVATGKSLAGKLLVDERTVRTILEPLERSAADIAALTREMREGRGILGMLLMDEEIAARLRFALRSFGRSIEDAREAAPISTLVGVLAGIF